MFMSGGNSRTSIKFGLYALMGILSFRRRAGGRQARVAGRDSVSWAQTSWGQKLIKTTTPV
jgi:hypothetical protein